MNMKELKSKLTLRPSIPADQEQLWDWLNVSLWEPIVRVSSNLKQDAGLNALLKLIAWAFSLMIEACSTLSVAGEFILGLVSPLP